MVKEFELSCHWKQGDDLASYISSTGDSRGGLIAWAQSFEENAKKLRKLAEMFEGKDLDIQAGTHYIGVSGDKETLERAEKEELIYSIEVDNYINEDYYDESKEKELIASQKLHYCYNCRKKLDYYEFLHANLRDNKEEDVLELWNSENLNFFCCKCMNQLECNHCNSKLEPLMVKNIIYLFYCPKCLDKKLDLLIQMDAYRVITQKFFSKRGNTIDTTKIKAAKEILLKVILVLEDYIINMRQFKRDDKFIIKNQINGKTHNIYIDADQRSATVKCLCGEVFYFNVEGSENCPNCGISVIYERK